MKKVVLIAVLFSMVTLSAKAQWFDFSQNAYDASVGVNLGMAGYHLGNKQAQRIWLVLVLV